MDATLNIPGYEQQLASYHRTFAQELKQVIAELPVRKTDRVLDVGCGDGFYTGLLADQINGQGHVVGVDNSEDYLTLAKQQLANHPSFHDIELVRGDITRLPFGDEHFDFVWCAQSLYSFREPLQALLEMRRVTRSGGLISVLDNDTLHEVMLPWPPMMELRLRTAELAAFQKTNPHSEKYYVGRNLTSLFAEADIQLEKKRSFSRDRTAPLDASCRTYLDSYLADLKKRVWPFLEEDDRIACSPYLDPASPLYVLNNSNLSVTFVDHVLWGRKA
jgi:ubiquinone/menaquinone biosynthesis C-methylase UbiE